VVSFMLWLLCYEGESPNAHWTEDWMGLRDDPDVVVKKMSASARHEKQFSNLQQVVSGSVLPWLMYQYPKIILAALPSVPASKQIP